MKEFQSTQAVTFTSKVL